MIQIEIDKFKFKWGKKNSPKQASQQKQEKNSNQHLDPSLTPNSHGIKKFLKKALIVFFPIVVQMLALAHLCAENPEAFHEACEFVYKFFSLLIS